MNGRPDKGLLLVLEVAQRLPAVPFRVVASQASPDSIEERIRSMGVDNVEVVDWTEDTASLYRDARVVLVPSYAFVETFSRVVLEAQRFGVPVIGSDRGNVPLLLEQSGTALPESAVRWAEEIARLYQDDAYWRDRAARARANSERYRFADQPARVARLVGCATNRTGVAVGAGIGNMIQCSPAIRKIAEHLGYPVDVVLNEDFPGCACLFAGAPWVGSVFHGSTGGMRFDTLFVFDSFGALLPRFNADRLVVSRRTFSFALMTKDMHEAKYNLMTASELLGISFDETDVGRYFIGEFDRGEPVPGRIGIHAGSKSGVYVAKRWPYFEALASTLAAQGFEIASFGSPNEFVPGTVNATGTNLQMTIENMRRCSYFVANDSGLMHVADALGIPLTAIFGPTSVVKNGPLSPTSQVIALNKNCAPCQFDLQVLATCACIKEIPLAEVLAKVTEHLSAISTARRG